MGLPGAKEGLSDLDPTIADLLKPHGYVCGQFGKNHVGDRNEHLPTVHGFDEFFGNLYHLNAEEEPEHPDYPKPEEYPNFRERFGPRGVLHTWAREKDDPKETAHFGPIGKQKIQDTGPLTKKRMETVDEEFTAAALDFMEKAHKRKKPFFVWWNSTRMHIWTHLKRRSQGKTGLGVYPDGMVEHDGHVGKLLDQLDKLGITENTIVDLLDRQRRRGHELARRRRDAVPRREGDELGGRVPRADADPLARRDRAWHGRRTRSARTRTS